MLKEKMATASILVLSDWKKEFHVHVDGSCIVLGVVLTQAGEGELDHLCHSQVGSYLKQRKNIPR